MAYAGFSAPKKAEIWGSVRRMRCASMMLQLRTAAVGPTLEIAVDSGAPIGHAKIGGNRPPVAILSGIDEEIEGAAFGLSDNVVVPRY
jgi:hypothetical protein